MSRAAKKREEKILHELQSLLDLPDNQKCADCNDKAPRWASTTIGCFLCIRCAGIHRQFGSHISKIKSVTVDRWSEEELEKMRINGNARVNAFYLPDSRAFPPPSNNNHQMEAYIRDKYERQIYRGKKSTARDIDAYAGQLRTLSSMGFTDQAKCIDALKKSGGNFDRAVEIMCGRESKKIMPVHSNLPAPPPPAKGNQDYQRWRNALEQLHNMGLMDDGLNIDSLVKSGGKIETAVELILNSTSSGRQRSPSSRPDNPRSPTVTQIKEDGKQKFILEPPNSVQSGHSRSNSTNPAMHTQPSTGAHPKPPPTPSAIDDLLGMEDAFAAAPIYQPQTYQSQTQFVSNNNPNKNSILSLYNSPTSESQQWNQSGALNQSNFSAGAGYSQIMSQALYPSQQNYNQNNLQQIGGSIQQHQMPLYPNQAQLYSVPSQQQQQQQQFTNNPHQIQMQQRVFNSQNNQQGFTQVQNNQTPAQGFSGSFTAPAIQPMNSSYNQQNPVGNDLTQQIPQRNSYITYSASTAQQSIMPRFSNQTQSVVPPTMVAGSGSTIAQSSQNNVSKNPFNPSSKSASRDHLFSDLPGLQSVSGNLPQTQTIGTSFASQNQIPTIPTIPWNQSTSSVQNVQHQQQPHQQQHPLFQQTPFF